MKCRHIPEVLSSISPVEPQICRYLPVNCGIVTTFVIVVEILYVKRKVFVSLHCVQVSNFMCSAVLMHPKFSTDEITETSNTVVV
jgi:hypothetical protein